MDTSDKPTKYSGTLQEDIEQWYRQIYRYALFKKWSPDTLKNAIPVFLKGRALASFDGIHPNQLARMNVTDIYHFLRERYDNSELRMATEQLFHSTTQDEEEGVEQFHTRLEAIGRKLQKSSEQVRFQFIAGIKDAYKDGLISREPQTLDAAVKFAIMKESLIDPPASKTASIRAATNGYEQRPATQRDERPRYQTPGRCWYCNKTGHKQHQCRAKQYADQSATRDNKLRYPPRFQAAAKPENTRQWYQPKQQKADETSQRSQSSDRHHKDFRRQVKTINNRPYCTRCNRPGHHLENCTRK